VKNSREIIGMHDHAEIKVGSEGLESIDATTLPANELRKSTKRDAAKSNASVAAAHPNEGDSFTGFDPQLRTVIDRWERLTVGQREKILWIVNQD